LRHRVPIFESILEGLRDASDSLHDFVFADRDGSRIDVGEPP